MSGGGGGRIILARVMQEGLTDPLVHGNLPQDVQQQLAAFIETDVSTWTHPQFDDAAKAFHWATKHC